MGFTMLSSSSRLIARRLARAGIHYRVKNTLVTTDQIILSLTRSGDRKKKILNINVRPRYSYTPLALLFKFVPSSVTLRRNAFREKLKAIAAKAWNEDEYTELNAFIKTLGTINEPN